MSGSVQFPKTNEEWTALGREVESDPTYRDMTRQGRPVTNVEMYAAMSWLREERRKAEEFLRSEL